MCHFRVRNDCSGFEIIDYFECGDKASGETVSVGFDTSKILKSVHYCNGQGQSHTYRVSDVNEIFALVLCKLNRISCRLDKSTTRDFVARADLSLRERSFKFRLRRNNKRVY